MKSNFTAPRNKDLRSEVKKVSIVAEAPFDRVMLSFLYRIYVSPTGRFELFRWMAKQLDEKAWAADFDRAAAEMAEKRGAGAKK